MVRGPKSLSRLMQKCFGAVLDGWAERTFDPLSPTADFVGQTAEVPDLRLEVLEAQLHPQDSLLALGKIGENFHRWLNEGQEAALRHRFVTLRPSESCRLTYSVELLQNDRHSLIISGYHLGESLRLEFRSTAPIIDCIRSSLAGIASSLSEPRSLATTFSD